MAEAGEAIGFRTGRQSGHSTVRETPLGEILAAGGLSERWASRAEAAPDIPAGGVDTSALSSRLNVRREDNEAADGERGMHADQYSDDLFFAETRGQKPGTEQRRQRDQCRSNHTEGAGTLIQPSRRPAQRKGEAAETGDGEKPMRRRELPTRSSRAIRPQMQHCEHGAQ